MTEYQSPLDEYQSTESILAYLNAQSEMITFPHRAAGDFLSEKEVFQLSVARIDLKAATAVLAKRGLRLVVDHKREWIVESIQ